MRVYCTENGIGLRLVSMRRRTNSNNQLITAAYVSAIVPGSAADRLHGELSEGIIIIIIIINLKWRHSTGDRKGKERKSITVCTAVQDCCKDRSNKYRKRHFWGSCRPETP